MAGSAVLVRWYALVATAGPENLAGRAETNHIEDVQAAQREARMLKVLMVVVLLIAAALVAGAYFHVNPAIAIFIILGGGIYMVGRIGGPALPEGTHVWGDTHGVHLSGRDFAPPDDSHSGGHLRDGVVPKDLEEGPSTSRAPRPMPAIRIAVRSRSDGAAPS